MAVVSGYSHFSDLLADGLRAAGMDLDHFVFDNLPRNNPGSGTPGGTPTGTTGGGTGEGTPGDSGTGTTGNLPDLFDGVSAAHPEKLVFALFVGLGVATGTFEANAEGVATHPTDRFIFETDTGKLSYDADGSNAGASTEIVTVSDHAWLTQYASVTGIDLFHI